MDGNFVENELESLIESAYILPQQYQEENKKRANAQSKYDRFTLKIKFNRALNPETVNDRNALITSGNKRVGIRVYYDRAKRAIIIKPKRLFARNRLHIVNISGKIMTEAGRSLRKHLYFAFRQNGNSLSFYRGVVGEQKNAPNKLPIKRNFLIPMIFLVSSIVLVLSHLYDSDSGLIVGTVIILIAVIAALIEGISDYGRSYKEYVYGAKLYNKGFFFEALECFERSLHHYPGNMFAQTALDAAIIKSSKADDLYEG